MHGYQLLPRLRLEFTVPAGSGDIIWLPGVEGERIVVLIYGRHMPQTYHSKLSFTSDPATPVLLIDYNYSRGSEQENHESFNPQHPTCNSNLLLQAKYCIYMAMALTWWLVAPQITFVIGQSSIVPYVSFAISHKI